MAKSTYSLKQRIGIVDQCFQFVKDGGTVCEFADSIGLARTTLYGWLKRHATMIRMEQKRQAIKPMLVPVTNHLPIASVPEKSSQQDKAVLPRPTAKAISIDLGYCRIELPQGCGSETIAMVIKGIKAAQ